MHEIYQEQRWVANFILSQNPPNYGQGDTGSCNAHSRFRQNSVSETGGYEWHSANS